MADVILVLNAGSSSLKFALFDRRAEGRLARVFKGVAEEVTGAARLRVRDAKGAVIEDFRWPEAAPGHAAVLTRILGWIEGHADGGTIAAVGHRVVHGGPTHADPVRVDLTVLEELGRYVPLAPLHQPHNLLPMRILLDERPGLPQVACFDTAFHRHAPDIAQLYAIPAAITAEGVRRYGFHGLSYAYIAGRLAEVDPAAAAGRVVALHLGNGASLCAMAAGVSVASTMGFTPLDGIPMGTRSGSLDPGVLLYLMREHGMGWADLEDLLYRHSGLLGVSGVASDMRALTESADPAARTAVDLFVYRIGREIGSLAAALGGLDALVFTAGIGENAAGVRARIVEAAGWLGVALDAAANATGGPLISSPASRIAAWVLPTDEEMVIARHAAEILAAG